MIVLTSHHMVERTPSGEEAWHSSTLLPDDRRVLGAVRNPHTVGELLQGVGLDPSTLEVVLQRLARRGMVRLDLPVQPQEEDAETAPASPPVSSDDALSSLLARHATRKESEIDLQVVEIGDVPVDAGIAESEVLPAPSREYDETPLPMHANSEQIASLMSALTPGKPGASQKSAPNQSPIPKPPQVVVDESEAEDRQTPYNEKDVDNLMRALTGGEGPAIVDLSLPPSSPVSSSRKPVPPSRNHPDGVVSAPRFLRMKDARKSDMDPASRLSPDLPSLKKVRRQAPSPPSAMERRALDEARREHAMRKRAERDAASQARRDAMAERRRAEQRADEGDSLMGMSARLRRVLDEQGRDKK